MLEPLLVGAGGMKFVDPLFQRAVIDCCKQRNIPVVFDEVSDRLITNLSSSGIVESFLFFSCMYRSLWEFTGSDTRRPRAYSGYTQTSGYTPKCSGMPIAH